MSNKIKAQLITASVIKCLMASALSISALNSYAATPTAYFQSSVISGSDNRINVSRVPVVDASGKISYKDVTINFTVDNNGVLLDEPATISKSPILVTNGFLAGNYKDNHGNKYVVSGPAVVTDSNRSAWSIALVSSPKTESSQFSLNWITGTVTKHPNQASLNQRKITSTAFSWGTMGENQSNGNFPFYNWDASQVIGANQAGNQLILHYYWYDDSIEDASVSLLRCDTTC
jgi:hypothetical protein